MEPSSMSINGYASPLNPYIGSTPASSTPTINVSFDRAGPGEFGSQPIPPPPLWPHRLSASFSAMADQIAAASQALALVPPTAFSGTDTTAELVALKSRLEGIERTQVRMTAEFEALKMQFTTLETDRGDTTEKEEREDAATAKLEEVEKKLNELSEMVKLDQQRLPARLHNARATVMKATLKTPVAANGKPAPGFPTSRGEFEHITKERYDALLKSFGQPVKGDTEARRETLRAFAGIPQDGQ